MPKRIVERPKMRWSGGSIGQRNKDAHGTLKEKSRRSVKQRAREGRENPYTSFLWQNGEKSLQRALAVKRVTERSEK